MKNNINLNPTSFILINLLKMQYILIKSKTEVLAEHQRASENYRKGEFSALEDMGECDKDLSDIIDNYWKIKQELIPYSN